MSETARFALIITLTGAIALAAVLVNRLSARLRLPAPVWMLAAAAIAVFLVPGVPAPRDEAVQQVVSVALVLILFNGGRHIVKLRMRIALVRQRPELARSIGQCTADRQRPAVELERTPMIRHLEIHHAHAHEDDCFVLTVAKLTPH